MSDYRARIYERYSSNFQDKGPVFNTNSAIRWGKAYDWYFRNWIPEDKNIRIADLGCGSGFLLHFFKERGYTNLYGVDMSLEQVTLSRQVIEKISHDNVLHFLQINEHAFDLITALDLIEHFNKDEVLTFLDGCYNALRPGGRLILQTPNAESPFASSVRYGDFTHEVSFQLNSLSYLLRLSSFANITSHEQGPIPIGYSLTSTLRFTLWQIFKYLLRFYNIVETGGASSSIFTRVFLISGVKT